MRIFPIICAVAIIPSYIAASASPIAAQNFEDRWSIIPKAHADPARPAPEQDPVPPTIEQRALNKEPIGAESKSDETGPNVKRTFTGKASFYSYRRAKTASGSSFDRDQLTAAHRSLPLGTKVRVTDLATNKSVVIRITDRGPFVRSRILDLSLGAARVLGIEDRGVVEIRAEVL